jgi:hypothetical protein
MFDSADDAEILRLTGDCLPSLTPCHLETVYLTANNWLLPRLASGE